MQLQEVLVDWWESFQYGHPNANQITWQKFREAFRSHHVQTRFMRLKRKEFLALKQGGMSMGTNISSLNSHAMRQMMWKKIITSQIFQRLG